MSTRTWSKYRRIDSSDTNVFKYVFEKEDAVAETVLYRYGDFNTRTVICCSTQSGCPVGCRFCGAGDRFVRSLTSGEIFEQVVAVLDDHAIDASKVEKMQIMFMSMGEPLLNFGQVERVLEDLARRYPNARLLLSTSAPDIDYAPVRDASARIPQVGLQFSVHESTDIARDALIPFRRKLNLERIANEGRLWHKATGRKPFFNYCARAGNVSGEDVGRLSMLFDPTIWECTVSVVCERDEHVAAANARQRELAAGFMVKMLDAGFSVRMFDPAGQDDIGGGCGQLWYVQNWMEQNEEKARFSVGAGYPKIHAPRLGEA